MSRLRTVRLRDVAELAGVSLKTASRVVNDEPGVRPEKVERVRIAVDELDFRRNEWARLLRTRTGSSIVGVVTEAVDDPFWAGVIGSLGRTLGDERFVLSATTEGVPAREETVALDLIERQVMGLVVVPVAVDQSYLEPTIRRGIPVVAVDRPARGVDVDTVLAADQAAAREGTRLLISVGHRRIAFAGRSSRYTTGQRLRGFRNACTEAGISSPPELVTTEADSPERITEFVEHLRALPDPPTAIMSSNVAVTVVLLTLFQQLDWRPGLVAFSEFATSQAVTPPTTVIDNSPRLLGAQAAALLERRRHDPAAPTMSIQVDTPLVIRESHRRFP